MKKSRNVYGIGSVFRKILNFQEMDNGIHNSGMTSFVMVSFEKDTIQMLNRLILGYEWMGKYKAHES